MMAYILSIGNAEKSVALGDFTGFREVVGLLKNRLLNVWSSIFHARK
jgi:hypothetical protein